MYKCCRRNTFKKNNASRPNGIPTFQSYGIVLAINLGV